jgi:putative transposase
VFFVDADREVYLRLLGEQCRKHGVQVLAYCLMTNHVHLVLTPAREDSLNLAVGRTHYVYTQYVNRLHGRSGHLWQGRFSSTPMDEAYAVVAGRYVERNPVRARMTRMPWTYRWSSAAVHTGARDATGLLDMKAWNELTNGMNWREHLTKPEDEETATTLRLNTRIGRPLASDSFLSKLEQKINRRLRPLPVGRPKKHSPKLKKSPK